MALRSITVIRLLFWLVLLPAVLLYFGFRLTEVVVDDGARGSAQRPVLQAPARAPAEAIPDARAADRLAQSLAMRAELAQSCLAQADRATAGALRSADPLLVIVAWRGCGEACDTDARASALADQGYLQGLRVLLLRTREDGPASSPAGVTTLVLPQCASLVQELGDDYFLRWRDGRLSSAGERHAAWLARDDDSATPMAFDPESLVAADRRAR